jgi:hypothetical protein
MDIKATTIILVFLTSAACGQSKDPKVKFDIDKILTLSDEASVLMEIDTQLNLLSNYGEDLNELTAAQKYFLFIENLEREVNNGGFHQFFFNSSGDHAHETLKALKAIGAFNTANIVEKSISPWPNNKVPTNRQERQQRLEEIEEIGNPIWDQCDLEFFKYEEKIGTLLLKFVRENVSDFKSDCSNDINRSFPSRSCFNRKFCQGIA